MKKEPVILALDPGHKLGYAVDVDGKVQTGICEIPRTYPHHGPGFLFFEAWLERMIGARTPRVLAWEAPLLFGGRRGMGLATNAAAIEFAFGIATIAELVAERRHIECWKVVASSARKHFTGNGRADKDQVFRAAIQQGYEVGSYDASDAVAIWDLVAHQYRKSGLVAGPLFRTTSP